MWRRLKNLFPYHCHFLTSGAHAWLALLTLGVGFAIALPLSIVLGLAAYGLGLIFLPEFGPFKRAHDERQQSLAQADLQSAQAAKEAMRTEVLATLSAANRARAEKFAQHCAAIVTKLAANAAVLPPEQIARTYDSFLVLLATEAELLQYQATLESSAQRQQQLQEAEQQRTALGQLPSLTETQQKLLVSLEETIASLQEHQHQVEQVQGRLHLTQAELRRMEAYIATLRGQLFTNPSGDFAAKIDDTLIQIQASQRVLKESGVAVSKTASQLLDLA